MLFNMRVLHALEETRGTPGNVVESLVEDSAKGFGVRLPVSLLHQSSFLGALYLTAVWLWEPFYTSDHDEMSKKVIDSFASRIDLSKLVKDVRTGSARTANNGRQYLRALRNALGHGRVRVEDSFFVFTDENPKNAQNDWIEFKLTWADAGRTAEAMFWAVHDQLYPAPSDGKVPPEHDAGVRAALDSVTRGETRSLDQVNARLDAIRAASTARRKAG